LENDWISRAKDELSLRIDKYHGKAFSPAPKSLEQILRHPVKAVEVKRAKAAPKNLS